MLAYGNYIVAWESRFFDGILTREGHVSDYFRAKYYMLLLFCIACYIVATPYVFFGIRIFWIQTACFLFNTGVNSLILLWLSKYNRKRMELLKGSAFSWQGSGATQFIILLPAMLLPVIIAVVFSLMGHENWGLGVLALLGAMGIVCHKWLINGLCRRFAHTKYVQAEGFRNN
jgi:MFS family permease